MQIDADRRGCVPDRNVRVRPEWYAGRRPLQDLAVGVNACGLELAPAKIAEMKNRARMNYKRFFSDRLHKPLP